jgi:hypothetical protein
LSGRVIYDNENNFGISNSKVILKNNVTGISIDSVQVQDNGYYEFYNINPGTYVITASSTYPWGGSNSTDALMIKKHIIGLDPTTNNPININTLYGNLSFLASDINKTNSLSGLDALYIQLRTVQLIDSFPHGDWVFSADTIVIYPSNFDLHLDVKGLCYGDVNKSYNPTNKSTILPIYLETQINQLSVEYIHQTVQNYKLQKRIPSFAYLFSSNINTFLEQHQYISSIQKNSQNSIQF